MPPPAVPKPATNAGASSRQPAEPMQRLPLRGEQPDEAATVATVATSGSDSRGPRAPLYSAAAAASAAQQAEQSGHSEQLEGPWDEEGYVQEYTPEEWAEYERQCR